MNATLICWKCGNNLKVVYDSWDDDPRLPRIIHVDTCKCVADRLETVLKVVDTCHSFIDRSGGNDISIKDWIEAKLAHIKKLDTCIADLDAEIMRQNDMLGGIH